MEEHRLEGLPPRIGYGNQALIVELIRAYLEDVLKVETRRTRISMLVPWDPREYSEDCYPNPLGEKWVSGRFMGGLHSDPLDLCVYNSIGREEPVTLERAEKRLPYACPVGIPWKGPGAVNTAPIAFSVKEGCRGEWSRSERMVDAYIVDAYLPGERVVDVVVEWCNLGLTDTLLSYKAEAAARIAGFLAGEGFGVKITFLPAYTTGSPYLNPVYWSYGADYYKLGLTASGLSGGILFQVYIVHREQLLPSSSRRDLVIPGIYGGWVHTFETGIPQYTIGVRDPPSRIVDALEEFYGNPLRFLSRHISLDERYPLEARDVIFHLYALTEKHGAEALKRLLPRIQDTVYTPGGPRGLSLLPWIAYFPGYKTVYSLSTGRPLYSSSHRSRLETLVYYLSRIKQEIISVEEEMM